MTTFADKLRAEPGVDIKRLRAGTHVVVVTENAVYNMEVLRADLGLVQVTSSDPGLQQATVGQFTGSQCPPDCLMPDWIGKDLYMIIRFRNGNHVSTLVQSAEVNGDNLALQGVLRRRTNPGVCP